MAVLRNRYFLISLAALLLSACSIGPDYVRPNIEVPEKWRIESSAQAASADSSWWEQLGDAELNSLVQAALSGNNDLRAAAARVERFYALYGASRSEFFPQANLQGQASRGRFSVINFPGATSQVGRQYLAEGNLSWELDVWGKIRRSTEAAWADLAAQEAFRRGVIVTLVSRVVDTYLLLRELDKRLAITKETLESRQHSLNLAQDRLKAGTTSELDLRQAESDLFSVQAVVPELELRVAQTENLLSVLLGRNPGPIQRGKTLDELLPLATVPSAMPASLIEDRPDIIQAEATLRAANARIGVARAAYLPSISLTGLLGYVSTDFSEWFHSPSREWAYGGVATMPLVTAGRVGNEVRAAEAFNSEAMAGYRSAVQNAFAEVENALIGYQKTGEQTDAQQKQVTSLRRYLELSVQRYDEGQSSYLEVLDAQRNLFGALLALSETEGAHLSQFTALYRALGGAWVARAETPENEPARKSNWIF